MFKILPFLMLLSFSHLSHAANDPCSPRDLREELGPARDQGDKSWCFAQPAADMATLALREELGGKPVSSEDLALTFHSEPANSVLADPRPELRAYLSAHPDFQNELAQQRREDQGTLTAEGLATEKGLVDSGGSPTSALLLANVRGFCLDEKFSRKSAPQIMHDLKASLRSYHKSIASAQVCHKEASESPESALKDCAARHAVSQYRKMVDHHCGARIFPSRPLVPEEIGMDSLKSFVVRYRHDPAGREQFEDKLFGLINEHLDKNEIAGIAWNADAIMARDPHDRNPYSGDHASIIAGRKNVGGTCYYLIRNSYGSGCGSDVYTPKFTRRCEAGHIWATRAELSKSVYSVFYLTGKKEPAPAVPSDANP